jgi:metal-dependent amidase/aminoacylase/carboxypeptidase family protein
MHIVTLLAAAETLLDAKNEWQGTVILCFQPAEEQGAGAQSMIDAGLYSKVSSIIPSLIATILGFLDS